MTYLGLGCNIGNKEESLRKAISELEKSITIIAVSPFYKTEAKYIEEQDWFLNCVVQARTELSAHELLKKNQSVEASLGRQKRVKFGPREIDIDILFYGQEIIDEESLQVPHPLLQERRFVLQPLCDIAPELLHPIFKKTVRELLKECKDEKIVEKVR